MCEISEEAIAGLKKRVWGEVLLAGDEGFVAACHTATLLTDDRSPALVVRPRGTMCVSEAIKFANENKLPVAVKGGGHSVAHYGLVKNGLTIDLSLMRSVVVDAKAKVATAEGGCLLGDIDRETAVYGLMVPLGHAPVTGMGLALGGGIGIGTHLFGATCEHLIGATVVKADGSVVDVDADSDPDLLWALKGAGCAMGVVTRMRFRLHDVSDAVTGVMMWPDDPEHKNWKTITRWMVDVGRHEPGYSGNCQRALTPDGPIILSMLMYMGPKSKEERLAFLQPLRDLPTIMDTVGQWRYVDTQFVLLDALRSQPPHFEYWTGGQLPGDKATDTFLEDYKRVTMDELPEEDFPLSMFLFDMWGGAMRNAEGPNSFANTSCDIGWFAAFGYLDPSKHEAAKAYARKVRDTLAAYGEGEAYANLTSAGASCSDASLAVRVGGAEKLERLRAIKARVDPENLFSSHPLRGL